MKMKFKIAIGEVTVPQVNIILKNINIEIEEECSIGEIKGVIEIAKELPNDLLAMYKNFVAADKEASSMDSKAADVRKEEGTFTREEAKASGVDVQDTIVDKILSGIKELVVSSSISEDIKNDETTEQVK